MPELDAPRHESADVPAEARRTVGLEVDPPHECDRHEERRQESDRNRRERPVTPEEGDGNDRGCNIRDELDRVDLMIEQPLADLHQRLLFQYY